MKSAIFALAFALLVAQTLSQPTGAPKTAPTPPAAPNAASLTPGSGSTPTDADILTFAYNLEVFEAQFYTCALNGTGISSSLLGGGPAPIGCTQATINSTLTPILAELAAEETAHVTLLYSALKAAGANPVAPLVNISAGVFSAAANLAANATLSPAFSPYTSDLTFYHGAFLFEDAGVSAYLGALNSISNSSYRLIGAQIGATEAYHASFFRTRLYAQLNTTTPFGPTVSALTAAIVALENTVAQAPQIKYTLSNNNGAGISNVNSMALAPAASAQQVLRLVTLGAPAGTGGGFFPNNLNGNVKN